MQTLATRREFLKVVGTAGVVSLAGQVPQFLSRAIGAESRSADRVLVLIQLAGGNDGLNTVVPISEDAYYRARPALAIPKNSALKIHERLGLHPGLTGLHDLWDAGTLAVVEGVGYPHPDRSHFRSMDIWQSAEPENASPRLGWLGRALDQQLARSSDWEAAAIGMQKLPLSLYALRASPSTVQSLDAFRLSESAGKRPLVTDPAWKAVASAPAEARSDLEFLRSSAVASVASAERLLNLSRDYRSTVSYPMTGLASRLKLVAQMVTADLPTRIYFLSLDGFDTHAQQLAGHAALMSELSGAISAFVADLSEKGHADRVMVATFSEFGRRLAENGSLGTDHGAASSLFVVTPGRRGGLYGAPPSLTTLDDGDPIFTTDFRRVYATWLDRWLKVPSHEVLGAAFEPLDFA